MLILVVQTDAIITIEIEPGEISEISDILHKIIIENQGDIRTHRKSTALLRVVKTVSIGIVQMLSFMITLIGANLLTNRLEQSQTAPTQHVPNNLTQRRNVSLEMCSSDFGCHQNICWKTCDANKTISNLKVNANEQMQSFWCYTTSTLKKLNVNDSDSDLQYCNYIYDCSPCWDCLGACHT